jgi:hypothetical protein
MSEPDSRRLSGLRTGPVVLLVFLVSADQLQYNVPMAR